jgi:dihydroxyacetone kinase DhaKLM complex PTS-EIIA-like component DhaM
MVTLKPQFDTHILDLELKKGESAQFAVAVSDYDLDLRGCLIFTEIRRSSPGYTQIAGFTGSVSTSGNTITITQYPKTLDKAQLLSQLPVRQGDLITLEGSGISGSKVIAVTDSQIVATGIATRSISEGRLLVRSLSLTSFTAVPYLPVISVLLTGTANSGATSMNVANVSRTIPAGTTLVFNDAGTARLATLTAELTANSTIAYVSALAATITSGAFATVGAKTVIASANAAISATSISATALSVPMPSGTALSFATRTTDGWQYVGSATLSASALASATTLAVNARKCTKCGYSPKCDRLV